MIQELQRRREEEVTGLQEQLADLTSKLEQLELNMKKYTASMAQMSELQRQREAENKEEEEAYRVKKRTFDLLPNADENIAKLQVGGYSYTGSVVNQPPPCVLRPRTISVWDAYTV